jgi:hypothetical protein
VFAGEALTFPMMEPADAFEMRNFEDTLCSPLDESSSTDMLPARLVGLASSPSEFCYT